MVEAKQFYGTAEEITKAMKRHDYGVDLAELCSAFIGSFSDEVAIVSAICKAAIDDVNSAFSLHEVTRFLKAQEYMISEYWHCIDDNINIRVKLAILHWPSIDRNSLNRIGTPSLELANIQKLPAEEGFSLAEIHEVKSDHSDFLHELAHLVYIESSFQSARYIFTSASFSETKVSLVLLQSDCV